MAFQHLSCETSRKRKEEQMRIREFGVEQWMNAWETSARWNLAETCCDSLTVAELLALAGRNDTDLSEILALRMGYGDIEGSLRLRNAISTLYETCTPDTTIVTHGGIGANALVYQTLIEPGDKVVSIVPNYQQHVSIPQSLGAEVQLVRLRPEDGWLPDPEALRRAITPGTKALTFSNPNNPTGALMGREALETVIEIAGEAGAWIVADEVYRGLDQQAEGTTASVFDLYEKGISTGGMSKAFSLAGLRLGWIAAPAGFIRAVSVHRDYNTISVGRIDDYLASIALEAKDAILGRNRALTRRNLAILADWVAAEPAISWVRPASGTTALLAFDLPMTSADFCRALQAETGVMLLPGSALDMEGTVRIGYACATDILRAGLLLVSGFLRSERISAR